MKESVHVYKGIRNIMFLVSDTFVRSEFEEINLKKKKKDIYENILVPTYSKCTVYVAYRLVCTIVHYRHLEQLFFFLELSQSVHL